MCAGSLAKHLDKKPLQESGSRGEANERSVSNWLRRLYRSSGSRKHTVVLHAILLAGACIIAYPLLWGVFTAFKPIGEIVVFPPELLPSRFTLDSFRRAFAFQPIGLFVRNSVIQSGAITLGQLVTATCAAYAFARLEFRGRNLLFYITLASMMIPIQVIMVPLYGFVTSLGWSNTFMGLTVPFLAHGFSIFLMRQAFLNIPRDIEEAAVIDGCGRIRVLWHVLIPSSRASVGAAAIFTAVYHWNTYIWPLLITSTSATRTVQPGLAMFIEIEAGTDMGRLMAAAIVVALPTVVAFLMGQRSFVRGVTMSGIKG